MNKIRKEIFTSKFHKLSPIEGFTEGKCYEILGEKAHGNVMMGMLYQLKDDNGNPRHVNSAYFVMPVSADFDWKEESDLRAKREELQTDVEVRRAEEIRIEECRLDNKIWSQYNEENDFEDIDLSQVRDSKEMGNFGKLVTAEEKLRNTLPVEPHLELKILCGLRTGNEAAEKNSFVIMEKAIAAMKEQIENLTQIKETLEFELKFLRRMDVIQE